MTQQACTCAARHQLRGMQRDSQLTDESIDLLAPPCPHHEAALADSNYRDPEHTCHAAPLCAYWFMSGGPETSCVHASCNEIVHEFCEACFVETMIDQDAGIVHCPAHGRVAIVDSASFAGYAGGHCVAVTLSCGCSDVDESADIAAAY